MFSIYTSLYNLDNGFIDWKDAIKNFIDFADEVVIATLPSDAKLLQDYCHPGWVSNDIKIVTCDDISLDDLAFDGKLKNAALKQCTESFCILLDGDERVRIADKNNWTNLARYLDNSDYDAFFIPVIDLFNTEREYKSLGQKWFLHKNSPDLYRGIVDFAWTDNTRNKINISKSDTCELIRQDGSLCNAASIVGRLSLPAINDLGAKVFHLGWLDKQKRLQANAFWSGVWSNRAGYKVNDIIQTAEELNEIEYWPHKLKLWYE